MSDIAKKRDISQAKEKARFDKLDAMHKKEGYTHRVDAWIHPSSGSDRKISFYMTKPTKLAIQKVLKRHKSHVLDDYQIKEL